MSPFYVSNSLASLLAKFRIRYSNLTMLSDVQKPNNSETRIMFENLIEPYRKNSSSSKLNLHTQSNLPICYF